MAVTGKRKLERVLPRSTASTRRDASPEEVLTGLDEPISPALRLPPTMVEVLAAVTTSLPTLLAMAVAALFALMAWAGSSTH